ncbi:MAG: TRAP transporter substrate-binding protein DctP [Treponema sp.]|jgi:TRAP-type C4-dicarboxylate transport system substrate-binding protein|nr:TRAP transporter substrate-binding protein DctP [Treponema sp.]
MDKTSNFHRFANRKVCILFVFCFTLSTGLYAQKVEIKLASSLPRNSDWGITLDRIAAEWIRVTNGEVELKVFHQRAGSENDYLKWLRQGRFEAAIFTSSALYSIAPEIMALSIPFLIRDNDEFDAVLKEVRPFLDTKIEEKGFKNLAWAKAGWVKIFSRSPIYTPDDLRKLKVATNPADKKLADAFKAMGFQLVGATINEIPQFLASRRIDAVYQSPIAVQATQLYKIAGNMSSINLAPFMGGILMNRKGWESIPQRHQARLQEIVRKAGIEIENSFQKREVDSIEAMKKDGVHYNQATSDQMNLWYQDMYDRLPDMVNKGIFNKEMYERINQILENYRRSR